MVKPKIERLVFIIVMIVAWQMIAISGKYSLALFPRVDTVLEVLFKETLNGELPLAIVYSFWMIIKGLVIALFISGLLVVIASLNKWMQEWVDLMITIAHPLPGIAILPLVILWCGIGEKAVLFVVIHSMVWPMTLTIKTEVIRLHEKYNRVSNAFNLSHYMSTVHIYIMGALPAVLTGARIGWGRGWRAFISAEMIFGIVGNRSGLGWYIFEQRVYMNSAGLFAGIIAIILCGVLMEEIVFKKAETWIEMRWK